MQAETLQLETKSNQPLHQAPATRRQSSDWIADLRAGVVVFLVALPLCLGIATASGASPLSGLIAGIVGGIVVGLTGNSALSVAGPAAGLTVIVFAAIQRLGFPGFLMATVLAGVIQFAAGVLRIGGIARMVPHAVVRGMLAAIGILLLTRQLPTALGYTGELSWKGITAGAGALDALQLGALATASVAAAAMFAWRDYGKFKLRSAVPAELIAVVVGMASCALFAGSALSVPQAQLVTLPLIRDAALGDLWTKPDFSMLFTPAIWTTALVLSCVASIESLLCVEATDRIDPKRRITDPSRELIGQGLANASSGLLGGLPVTAVVVRSFTNLQAGARSRWSAVIHGVFLLAALAFLGPLLNFIPLATLAVVLSVVAYKLTPPRLYTEMWRLGKDQFIPFIATVVAVVATDLMTGTLTGLVVAVVYAVWKEYRAAVIIVDDGGHRLIRFASNIWFLHKVLLREALFSSFQRGTRYVLLDGTAARRVDPDVIDLIREFSEHAAARGVEFSIYRSASAAVPFFREEANA
ncbi:MAG TPA: SulP family inorganic anion transporter [Polyangiaceae bacterium]